MCDFMLDTIALNQRGNLCVSTGRLLQIQSSFIPHEDLQSSSKGLKAAARGPHCVSSQIKPLYYYHEKHVTLEELKTWHLKLAKEYWISSLQYTAWDDHTVLVRLCECVCVVMEIVECPIHF